MKIVGLTGGIGSGKTTVCKLFEKKNIPVFYADDEAKALYKDPAVVEEVRNVLEVETLYDENNNLNKVLIASIIFSDEKKRLQVNSILHPLVKKRFDNWMAEHSSAPYCIREAAILIESGAYKDCDSIIVVTADMEVRVQRVMQRDNSKKEEVIKRIQSQLPEEKRISYADHVITNNGSVADLQQQVNTIHSELL